MAQRVIREEGPIEATATISCAFSAFPFLHAELLDYLSSLIVNNKSTASLMHQHHLHSSPFLFAASLLLHPVQTIQLWCYDGGHSLIPPTQIDSKRLGSKKFCFIFCNSFLDTQKKCFVCPFI